MYQIKPSQNNILDSHNIYSIFSDRKNQFRLDVNLPLDLLMSLINNVPENIEVILTDKDAVCPVCGEKLVNNGTETIIFNKKREIKLQKYICKKHKKFHTESVNITHIRDKYSVYTKDITDLVVDFASTGYIPYSQIGELIEKARGVKLSRQTVCSILFKNASKYLKKMELISDEEIIKLMDDFTGVIGYDEQHILINKVKHYRLTMVEPNLKIQLNEIIVKKDDFNTETIDNFFNNTIGNLKVNYIVTDGDPIYKSIIEKYGALQKRCTFHNEQNKMNDVNKEIGQFKRNIKNYTNKIKKNKEKINEICEYKREIRKSEKSKTKINKIIKNKNEKIRKLKKENSTSVKKRSKIRKKLSEYR